MLVCNTTDEEFCSVWVEKVRSLYIISFLGYGCLDNEYIYTLITIEGRFVAVTDDAKRAPLSAAAAIEATPNVFIAVVTRCCDQIGDAVDLQICRLTKSQVPMQFLFQVVPTQKRLQEGRAVR